jgi:hypothetical protein
MRSSTTLVRICLPAVIALAGAILLILGDEILGLALLGTAVCVAIANWYVRLSIGSQHDREDEDAARRHFSRTGRWPDE